MYTHLWIKLAKDGNVNVFAITTKVHSKYASFSVSYKKDKIIYLNKIIYVSEFNEEIK